VTSVTPEGRSNGRRSGGRLFLFRCHCANAHGIKIQGIDVGADAVFSCLSYLQLDIAP
jgi:hypothetical protein